MSKTDATWLSYCYIVFAVIVSYVFNKAIDAVGIEMLWKQRYEEYFLHINNFLSITLGVLSAYLLSRNKARKEYHLSVVGEVKKVRWPTYQMTKQMTLIVAIVVAIFAVILFFFDQVWKQLLIMLAS